MPKLRKIFSLVSRPFCWPITTQVSPLKRARPPTIAVSSANTRSPCSSSNSGEEGVEVVERVGPLRVTRHLRDLPRVQLAVDFLRQRLALLLQARDLLGDVERGIVLHEAQLLDLGLELGDRLLEIEKCRFHGRLMIPQKNVNHGERRDPANMIKTNRTAETRREPGFLEPPRRQEKQDLNRGRQLEVNPNGYPFVITRVYPRVSEVPLLVLSASRRFNHCSCFSRRSSASPSTSSGQASAAKTIRRPRRADRSPPAPPRSAST